MGRMNMNEPKSRERFVKLAENRVARAIKDIRLIGNLSNRSNYTYSEDDVKKIVNLHKGKIKLKSEINKGTGITIILPVVK